MTKLDILFVNANSAEINYQQLAEKFTAIETPIWARNVGKPHKR